MESIANNAFLSTLMEKSRERLRMVCLAHRCCGINGSTILKTLRIFSGWLLVSATWLWSLEAVARGSMNLDSQTSSSSGISISPFFSNPLVSIVLFSLVALSTLTWAVFVAKWIYLLKIVARTNDFSERFWESRSLNELNGQLADFPYSPTREIFRSGYSELVKASKYKDSTLTPTIGVNAAIDTISRSLHRSRINEKRNLERFLPFLAISASAAPFLGLFGTVWGIMTAFEGIAQSGSTSLVAVAPGISEALVATAFGLGAAIPAVIGYNIAVSKIRSLVVCMEGFGIDFLNIVERYLVIDCSKPSKPTDD